MCLFNFNLFSFLVKHIQYNLENAVYEWSPSNLKTSAKLVKTKRSAAVTAVRGGSTKSVLRVAEDKHTLHSSEFYL